jgi:hypothetical protein
MSRDKILEFIGNQDELTLIDLMRVYQGKEDIIEIMKEWEDDKLEEAAENMGYKNGQYVQ